jgi:hypothetical protein
MPNDASVPSPRPANEYGLLIGGLFRCCTQTFEESTQMAVPGDILKCRYCSASMRLEPDGNWQWARDLVPPEEGPGHA